MKEVTIHSIGSCDTATRKGRYCVSLQYGEHVKYLSAEVSDTTANRCIILGLVAAVEQLKEPCQVTLVTSTPIGVKKGERSKGPNGDLVKSLLQALALGGHDATFDVWAGRGEELNTLIASHREQAMTQDL